ncbi:MAG: transcriptional regulator [Chloroflexi bacterium]|nr:transcriptional regulator [Chloroflexota bacterium]
MQWYIVDLHTHTPASADYQQPEIQFIDLLLRAEARNIAIIALTDHNTVAGYKRMQEEIQQLELLEKLKRLLPEEEIQLREYRRLLQKILVLPGFEFTATFGFHILSIFSPDKPVREIEHLLIDLRIPTDQLDSGSATIGASSDVLTAYRLIAEAGGLVIAAHANSNNGIAMRGFPIGGQTKIAYTQDKNLHALEVTDLDQKGSRSTAAFFNGTKPEYPRRMHCIQGSDSHRLTIDPLHKKNLGVGDRATDVLLPEVSFEALYELFTSHDFARTRPHRHKEEPVYDFIRAAREEGANIVQAFHESMAVRGGKRYAVLADICAFANTNGGTLYIGISDNPQKPVVGILDAEQSMASLEKEISDRISPLLQCTLDLHDVAGKKILRVLVPRGEDPPYAVDQNKIYVRAEAETGMAVRDEIVELVKRGLSYIIPIQEPMHPAVGENLSMISQTVDEDEQETPPRTGVEVVAVHYLTDLPTYTMRDLRNGNVVKNVTLKSARRLWHYAITSHANLPEDISKANIVWQGDFGLIRRYKQDKKERYDLIQRTGSSYRYYFGVTEDGIHGAWKQLVGQEED